MAGDRRKEGQKKAARAGAPLTAQYTSPYWSTATFAGLARPAARPGPPSPVIFWTFAWPATIATHSDAAGAGAGAGVGTRYAHDSSDNTAAASSSRIARSAAAARRRKNAAAGEWFSFENPRTN